MIFKLERAGWRL